MCGIAGFQTDSIPRKEREDIIGSMLDVMHYRGPDDRDKVFIDDVSFGHVRLSIIDIEHGRQPMQSADGRYTIISNGEIYNYLELRQQLIQKGFNLRTFSDTEVLLYMYVEQGIEMFQYINGMFAFAIYDNREKTLFLARDHFGIKPLYYYADNGSFVFASEIKALLKYPSIKAELDEQSLYEYLTFQMILKKHTLFKNIYKLEPATYVIVRDGSIVEKKEYWELDYTIDDSKGIDEYADELLVLLENSLSLQIRSDVPVGAQLSGGLDSSIVTTLAAKSFSGNFKTFTGGFKEAKEYDETRYARIISNHVGSEHFEIFPTYRDFAEILEKLVYHMDEPGGGPGIFPQYMVSKLAAENVKVVLGGHGGDEVFGGYARYAVAYLEQCIKGAIFETQEEGKHIVTLQSIIPNMPILKDYVPLIKEQFSSGLFEDMDRRYFRIIDRSPRLHEIYTGEVLSNRNNEQLFDKFSQIFNRADTKSYFNKMTHFDIKTLLPTLLQIEDRMSMAVSLESRAPLLDRRIVELSTKIPPTFKFAGGKTKNILLQAVKNILPKEIVSRKDKMGFPVPVNEWFAGPLKGFILDIFNSKNARERGIYRLDCIEGQIVESSRFSRNLWGALNIEIWFRSFID